MSTYPRHVLERNRRIADRVYMRLHGIDVPHPDEFDELVELPEVDDKQHGFRHHTHPERPLDD